MRWMTISSRKPATKEPRKGGRMPRSSYRPAVVLSAILLSLLVVPAGAFAPVARRGGGSLDRLTLADPRLQPSAATARFEEVQSLLPAEVRDGWNRFLTETAG